VEQPAAAPRPGPGTSSDQIKEIGDSILDLLAEKTENPSEAFVLLQQLGVFLWDNYKIDWDEQVGHPVAATRKQRYLDFVSGLIDNIEKAEHIIDFTNSPDPQ
jgi:hypothetical protein